MAQNLTPNQGKSLEIEVAGEKYSRFPIKTHLFIAGDNAVEVIKKYTQPYLLPGDMIFVSEKIIAISQGRAYPIKDIKPSWLAKLLVKFVHKTPSGIGLGSPWTMQLALKEAGAPRILLAALISAVTKPFGIKGLFYRVAGNNVNAIDGPCSYTLPPYNEYAKLGPKDPDSVAKKIKEVTDADTIIIDANDLGVNVLGKSNPNNTDKFCQAVFRDNPLGQTTEQTPICIVRKFV